MPQSQEAAAHLVHLTVGDADDELAHGGLSHSGPGEATPQGVSHERAHGVAELLVALRQALVAHPAGGVPVVAQTHKSEVVREALRAYKPKRIASRTCQAGSSGQELIEATSKLSCSRGHLSIPT